jgi:hypothetical protein
VPTWILPGQTVQVGTFKPPSYVYC